MLYEHKSIIDTDHASADAEQAGQSVGQAAEIAVAAPVRFELNQREKMLFGCCVNGDVGKVRRLLKYGNVDINMADEKGTLLCYAAFYGHAAIVGELLSRPGIDVNLAQAQDALRLRSWASRDAYCVLPRQLGQGIGWVSNHIIRIRTR